MDSFGLLSESVLNLTPTIVRTFKSFELLNEIQQRLYNAKLEIMCRWLELG